MREALCYVPPQAFVDVVDQMRADPYLSPHIKYYMREMRVVAYAQVWLQGFAFRKCPFGLQKSPLVQMDAKYSG